MKIKLFCDEEHLDEIKQKLMTGEFEFADTEGDLYIFEAGFKKNTILGKNNDEYVLLQPDQIIYVESFGNDVICGYTNGKDYFIKEKLYEIDALFYEHGLIRINKSLIINVNYIQSIKTSLNMKYNLTLSNNKKVTVTRTYYYNFKSYIGL